MPVARIDRLGSDDGSSWPLLRRASKGASARRGRRRSAPRVEDPLQVWPWACSQICIMEMLKYIYVIPCGQFQQVLLPKAFPEICSVLPAVERASGQRCRSRASLASRPPLAIRPPAWASPPAHMGAPVVGMAPPHCFMQVRPDLASLAALCPRDARARAPDAARTVGEMKGTAHQAARWALPGSYLKLRSFKHGGACPIQGCLFLTSQHSCRRWTR